ncbi:hypothetical protein L195_g050594 [Trifolium pratense]|uniref:Uncharacterized protein n=1 Tax=Trifolium pratense TaxID=57577 RepID=A0A2K3JUW5_TRIPR|nr:hypothetical protein L195_g050594 [Trifolium pratense]
MFLARPPPLLRQHPEPPHDLTIVSEPVVVDTAPCVESLLDRVFRRGVPLMAHNGGTSG